MTGAVFSFMDGTVHPYYTVALAPAIAALVGISVRELWRGREFLRAADRAGDHVGGHRRLGVHPAGPHAGLVARAAVDRAGRIDRRRRDARRRCAPAGPRQRRTGHRAQCFSASPRTAAYTIETVAHAHSGPMVTAGPAARMGGAPAPGGPDGRGPRCAGGQPRHSSSSSRAADNRWAAASVGSMTASSLELEDRRVGDGDRRVHRFGQLADAGAVPGLRRRPRGAVLHRRRAAWTVRAAASRAMPLNITAWVQQNFTPIDVGGTTVYDLERTDRRRDRQ